jgi:hypothetical protein
MLKRSPAEAAEFRIPPLLAGGASYFQPVGRKNAVRRLWRSQVAGKTLLLRWMLGRRGWECYVPRLGVHDGAAGAVWAASGRRCAQCEQFVAPVPGVENLTAISNRWAPYGTFFDRQKLEIR